MRLADVPSHRLTITTSSIFSGTFNLLESFDSPLFSVLAIVPTSSEHSFVSVTNSDTVGALFLGLVRDHVSPTYLSAVQHHGIIATQNKSLEGNQTTCYRLGDESCRCNVQFRGWNLSPIIDCYQSYPPSFHMIRAHVVDARDAPAKK